MIDLNLDQIKQSLAFADAVERISEAFIKSSRNEVQTGEVVHLAFKDHNGDCHVKSGHIDGTEAYVVKIASGFYDNPQKGLRSSNGMMLAFSAETGVPLAILRDEGWLTDVRTGIGGALATKALAAPSAQEVLVIGTGLQAYWQVKSLAEICPDRALHFAVFGLDPAKAEALAGDLQREGITAVAVLDLQPAVQAAQIIVTTTPSQQPLMDAGWVQPGTHITAVGADSPGKQELPVALVQNADLLVCDMTRQSLAHGEFQHAAAQNPNLQVVELGAVLSGGHPGRSDAAQISIADLTGIAAQDIAISQSIISIARAETEHA